MTITIQLRLYFLQLTQTMKLQLMMLLLAFQAALHFTRAAPMAETHNTKALPGDITLQSLHGVADTVATETSTVAYNTYVFMVSLPITEETAYQKCGEFFKRISKRNSFLSSLQRQFFDKDPPHQTPCFNTERNTSADVSHSNTTHSI